MPEGSGIGLYPYGEVGYALENDEVSSTYEGRHLTVTEAQVTGHEHTWVTKGHPVVVGENIVGVVLAIERTDGTIGAAANAATDYITIDTEGIFLQSVVATDDLVNDAVIAGDELFISKTTGIISKNDNKNTHTHFGYALGGVTAGNTAIISVKVHWDPSDLEEEVGTRAAPFVSANATHEFRKYCYEGQGGSEQVGDWLELSLTTVASFWAAAMFRRLHWTSDANWVTGYSAVAEFELAITEGTIGSMDTATIIQMNSMVHFAATGHNNFRFSWMRMTDYADNAGELINNIFDLDDQTLVGYPMANDATNLFVASSGDIVVTHTMKFLVNGVNYWFLCANSN